MSTAMEPVPSARAQVDGERAAGTAAESDPWETRFVAPMRPSTVPLRALIDDRLSGAVGRVAIIAAPGGYGKSSQAAAWAAAQPRPVAWADLARMDNDPIVLLAVLVRLLAEATGLDASVLPATRWTPQDFAAAIVPWFGELVARCARPFVIVLDDVHVIDAPEAIDLLDALAANVPPDSTVVLVGRAIPGTPLGRLRVRPGVVEVTMDELALTVIEAAAIFRSMDLELSEDSIASLVERTEGWPVGLRLAGLALVGQDDLESAACEFSGQDRYIVDYVREEWMSGLTLEDGAFLMRAACLDWFSSALCDDVLERSESSRPLERLHTSTLMVIPLDRRHDWYRVHHLLADHLQAEFRQTDPGGYHELHRRACAWFEARGDVDRAFHHAMQAGDLYGGELLVTRHMASYVTKGRHASVERWLSSFPEGYVTSRPAMCVAAAGTAFGAGDAGACERWVRFLGHALASSDPQRPADEATGLIASVLQALVSTELPAALLDGIELAHLGLEPGPWHTTASIALGGLRIMSGEDAWAARVLTEAAAEAKVVGSPTLEAIALAYLAFIHDGAGDTERAADVSRRARDVLRTASVEHVPTTMLVPAMHSLAAARDGDADTARADWALARRHLAKLANIATWASAPPRLALARASLLFGDQTGARALLDEANPHIELLPDASVPRRQLAELRRLVDTARDVLPYGPASLTSAELRVLHYLPTNLSLADIARRLYVARNTAKSHAAAIYRKLGTNSRGDAVEVARRAGLVPTIKVPGGDDTPAVRAMVSDR